VDALYKHLLMVNKKGVGEEVNVAEDE